ncbi:hypothetical protein PMAYCL1PPCAC_26860, partial [Pristionchus mayeri]
MSSILSTIKVLKESFYSLSCDADGVTECFVNERKTEPKDELIDSPSNDHQQFNTDLIGDGIAYKDEPLQEEEGDLMTDNLIENGGIETEMVDNGANKDSSTVGVVEKRRRSSRKVSQNVKYTESGE